MSATSTLDAEPNSIIAALMELPTTDPDPYPLYERLREIAPSHRSQYGLRFVSRYNDIHQLLRSPDFRIGMFEGDPRYDASPWLQNASDFLAFSNPPKHDRLRALVSRAFTQRFLETHVGPLIDAVVDRNLTRCAASDTFDVVAELAVTVPAEVICELLGIPSEDQAKVVRWMEGIGQIFAPILTDATLAGADHAIVESHQYLDELINKRRRQPREDLLSKLVAVSSDDGRLTTTEVTNFTLQLLSAGSETTMNLIGIGTLVLLQRPDLLTRLRQRRELMTGVVDELLRFEPPVHITTLRTATVDTTLGDHRIEQGEVVTGLVGAGNRDPAIFIDPNVFDTGRESERPPLTFGSGIHYCLGAALVKGVANRLFRGLLIERFPTLHITGEAVYRPGFWVRGLGRLELAQ